MKLIIKQYLASLKERGELEVLLPDLLAAMGLNVFLKPGIGTRQYGVDVAAVGRISGQSIEKVYLFSVKAGDLDRSNWDSSPQALRASVNEIFDVFIRQHIPTEHKKKPIEICLCFGGMIKEDVRSVVSGFIDSKSSENVQITEWNGDYLAALIEKYLLREELLPEDLRSNLRKSLAMIEEPEVSFKYFRYLVLYLTKERSVKDKLLSMRQLCLCLWVLYSWSRDENNLESSYKCAEFSLLCSWPLIKDILNSKKKQEKSLIATWLQIQQLYFRISREYFRKISKFSGVLNALSIAVHSPCAVDTNLKVFDLLGRIALHGIWADWEWSINAPEKKLNENNEYASEVREVVKRILINNRMVLEAPLKDDQIVDIALAILFLKQDSLNEDFVRGWLKNLVDTISHLFVKQRGFPITRANYEELIKYSSDRLSQEDLKECTKATVLHPYLAFICALLDLKKPYSDLKTIKSDFLSHSTYQFYFLNAECDDYFYRPSEAGDSIQNYGLSWMNFKIDLDMSEFLNQVKTEIKYSSDFYQMSSVEAGVWPLILTGCRHYRLPIPLHFFLNEETERVNTENSN